MAKSVLYIAFHYPPIQMSSGVHRSMVFSRHLAQQQWDVTVLTVDPRAYIAVNQLQQVPTVINVKRCFALDTARHLSIGGRYLSWLAQPDRWISWLPAAVWQGYQLLRKREQAVIVSTYPIATAHIIGYLLHKLTGCSWVADLRDPMLQKNYPADLPRRKIFGWIEQKIIRHASAAILTSPGAIELYRQNYPQVPAAFWHYIPNGYDEAVFADLPVWPAAAVDKFTLLHSGTVYPTDRDPTALFDAIQQLKQTHPELANKLRVILRATGHDELYQAQLSERGIADIVELAPAVNYREAAAEMLAVDALLLMQADTCNYQTPAKAYEYIRAQRPVLVLAPERSDTWQLIQQTGAALRAELNNAGQIMQALRTLLQQPLQSQLTAAQVASYSRSHGAVELESLLGRLLAERT